MTAVGMNTAISIGRAPPVTQRHEAVLVARVRVLLIAVLFGLVALTALVRIVWLGIGGGMTGPASLEEALLPQRGEIVDRNGMPMARNFPARALWFNPRAMGDGGDPLVRPAGEIAGEIAAIFPDLDKAVIERRLTSGKAGYLRRRVLPEEANRLHALGELALEMPEETDRHYPQGSLGAHVLGYVDP